MTAFIIIGIVAILVVATVLFMNLSPQFGGSPSAEQKKQYATVANYQNGKFSNPIPTSLDMDFGDMMGTMVEFLKGGEGREPGQPLPQQPLDSTFIADKPDTLTRMTWFGHSTFLLEINGKNVLIDPMFGPTPAPIPVLGPKRFNAELPIAIEKLPKIDLVLLSHDHYDHLDYGSILKLKEKVDQFFVPLGVGAHLKEWGVQESRIREFNWWDEAELIGLSIKSAPARHFSGRGLGDRFSTLWCSWIIQREDMNIFFSGDSGYGPHFKEIGEKYGPFNFAMMECGQYNEKWKEIHMMPEETAIAGVDVKAERIMPIHWGAFRLAFHHWKDPIERVSKKAQELGLPLVTPIIGEPFLLKAEEYPSDTWWESL